MDVSTPPSLDLACPQAKAEIEKYVHMFRDRGVDKNKIRTWGWYDLQRIHNFLLLHAILSSVLDIIGLYYPLLYYFWD